MSSSSLRRQTCLVMMLVMLSWACWLSIDTMRFTALWADLTLASINTPDGQPRACDVVYSTKPTWYSHYLPKLIPRFKIYRPYLANIQLIGYVTTGMGTNTRGKHDPVHQFLASYVLAPTVVARGKKANILLADYYTQKELIEKAQTNHWQILVNLVPGVALVKRASP